jgi:hypothetical protein
VFCCCSENGFRANNGLDLFEILALSPLNKHSHCQYIIQEQAFDICYVDKIHIYFVCSSFSHVLGLLRGDRRR